MKTTLGLLRIERKSEGLLVMNLSLTSMPILAWFFSATRENVCSTMVEVSDCQLCVGERSEHLPHPTGNSQELYICPVATSPPPS